MAKELLIKPKHTNMKRSILLLLFIATIGLVSCEKEVYVPNDTLPNITFLDYIEPNEWQYNSSNQTYNFNLDAPEIDKATFENDDVSLMISRGNTDYYEKIPFVYDGLSWSYEISQGKILVSVQTSGTSPQIPAKPTTTTRVKVVIVRSSL